MSITVEKDIQEAQALFLAFIWAPTLGKPSISLATVVGNIIPNLFQCIVFQQSSQKHQLFCQRQKVVAASFVLQNILFLLGNQFPEKLF